jgi:DNA-binding XRE family transcriptional regulator
MAIEQKVKEFRIAKKMSKAALARRIGVARSYITKLENGQLQPSGPMMLRFAHVLQRPVEDIFLLIEVPSGEAAFHRISRRASVRAGESNNTADINKHKER